MTATTTHVERIVTEQVLSVLGDPQNRRRIYIDHGEDVDEPSLLEEIGTLLSRKQGLIDMIADGLIEAVDARVQVEVLNRRLDEARVKLHGGGSSPLLELPTDPKKLRAKWNKMTPAERRVVIKAATERITVRKATTRGSTFEDERVTVTFPGGVPFKELTLRMAS